MTWYSKFVPLFRFTQDPNNSNYMIVMGYANKGNLRNSLKKRPYYSWLEIIRTLSNIISGLKSIHHSNLVHCDLHDGNILFGVDEYISDLGLCKPIDYFQNKSN